MDSRQEFRRLLRTTLLKNAIMNVTLVFQIPISLPTIRANGAAWLNACLDKSTQFVPRRVAHNLHPCTSEGSAAFFDRDRYQRLVFCPSPRGILGPTDIGFVDFDQPVQSITSWANHGSPEFVQPGPGSLIAAQSQILLKAFSAGSVLLARDRPHRPKPHLQRFPCVLEDRARGRRNLTSAISTVKQLPPRLPGSPRAANGTNEPIRPANPDQIVPAGLFRGKSRFKFHKCSRIVFHAPTLQVGIP
jgi:hypothetical protein